MVSLRILGLASLAVAARSTLPPNTADGTIASWDPSDTDKSTCVSSTFHLDDKNTPADWRACAALYSSWDEKGVYHVANVSSGEVVPILQYRGCTFAVSATNNTDTYQIGNMDIKTILDQALKTLSSGTNLAGKGDTACEVQDGSKAPLHWQIFNPNAGK